MQELIGDPLPHRLQAEITYARKRVLRFTHRNFPEYLSLRDVFGVLIVLAVLAGGVELSRLASSPFAATFVGRLHASPMLLDARIRMRERESVLPLSTPPRYAGILSEERATSGI